ncbi:hypothetical protein RhiJN_17191 [Ceratobasidium sp. AG-Ba]|nr:hypothetical protein RhiJN_17191 [Ceratobasidium sp. AG-Ba]
MPTWTFDSFKVFRSRPSPERRPATDLPGLNNNSINIRVHTQRSHFTEPPRKREPGPKSNHIIQHDAPYGGAQLGRRQKPRPLSISYSLPCLPCVAVRDPELPAGSSDPTDISSPGVNAHDLYDEWDQSAEAKRARRQGMLNYPEDIREGLRKIQSKPKLFVATDEKRPPCPYYPYMNGPDPTSVYSDATSGYGEQIRVSSLGTDSAFFEPPSWFSDQSTTDEEASSRYPSALEDFGPDYLQHMMSFAARASSANSRAGPSDRGSRTRLHHTKSWETFQVPSVPPSPTDDSPPARRAPPRDPRLPPADYFSHKEDYDAAAIARYGAIPPEWIQYDHAHHHNRV